MRRSNIKEEVHAMVTGGGGGLEKKISESIQLTESKKNDLEKSILSLVDQWKEFEGELNIVQKDFCEGLRELDAKEQRLNFEKESLELNREWLEQSVREIRDRETDFALFRDKKIRDLERREREFDRVKEAYGKAVCEPLGVQEKRVEGLLATLKSEKLEVEGLKNVVEKRLKEIGLEEEALKTKRKEAEISIEERTKELNRKEEKLKEREKKAELKEEQLNFWKERQIEIEAKERQLQLTLEDLEFQEKKIDFIRKLNEKRMEELDLKEKQLNESGCGCGSEREVLGERWEDLESQRKEFGEEIKELELRKKELEQSLLDFHSKNEDFQEESGKLQQEKEEFQLRVKQFELTERELEKSLKQFDLEKKELLTRTQLLEMESKDLESKLRKLDRRIEELNAREKVLEKSFQDFHMKEKQLKSEEKLIKEDYNRLESWKKELEERIMKFELKEKELGLNEKKIESEKELLEKDSKHLASRRKELEESINKFECREKEFGLKEKKIESEKKLLEKDSKQLESGRKELEERIQKLELREKQLDSKENELSGVAHSHANAHLKTEPGRCEPVFQSLLSANDTDLKFVIEMMRGKDLQIFLNEHGEKDNHLIDGEEVLKALQLSKDPGKLVLDAMEGFYPPHLNKGNGEFFSSNVVRRSCMLLLQQLIKISPQIQPGVRDDALNLAREWKAKLNMFCSVELSAFLYLLGAYDLGSAFDADEILSLLCSLSMHEGKLQPELCCRLGLKVKITSFIKDLLKHNLSLEAIKYIYGFELVDLFPPVPILKNYLKHVKMYAHTMLRKRHKEINAQNEFIDTRIAALRSVIKCIVDYKLESEYSTKDLENSIKQLLKQKKDKELKGSSDCNSEGKQNVEVKQISSTASPSQPKAHKSAPSRQPNTQGSSPPSSQPNAQGSSPPSSQPNAHGSSPPSSQPNAKSSSPPSSQPNAHGSSPPSSQPNAHSSSPPSSQPKAHSSSPPTSQPNAHSYAPSSQPKAPSHAPSTQPKALSHAQSTQPKAPGCAADLSNPLRSPSHPMAFIIANMDGKNLLSFLSSHFSEHELMRDEISSALQISYNSPKLVLDAVENLYDSYLTDEELKSCVFLLELLEGLSPDIIMPDVKEAAQNVAFNWEAKLKARNRNYQLTSAYLLLISAYKLDFTLHRDELLNFYETIAEQEPSIALPQAVGIFKDVSSAARIQLQAEIQKATSSTSMVHGLDDQQSQCTDMDLEEKESVSVHTEVPTFINISSDPAGLILDALRNCLRSNLSGKKSPHLLAKSFYRLLEHLTAVSLEIKPNVKERACEFFLEWKAKSIGSHMWETLGRLQLIAAYQLSSSFSSNQIFCLLEMVHPPKKVASLIRIFGLVEKVPDFISELIRKKKLLVSFAYVYEFSLADMFPPVALLKQYVLYSKVVAKRIFCKGNKTTEAQDKSIESKISALKNVIRLIIQHNLESEYSTDELRSTIKGLEIQRANLKKTHERQKEQVDPEVEYNNKRRRPTSDSINEATTLQPGSKFRRSVSKSSYQFSNRHQIHQQYELPPQHPGDSNKELSVQPYLRTPGGNYSLSGGGGTLPLVCVPQNEFLPSNLNPSAYNYIPPLWRDGNESLFSRWCDPHNHQRTH